MVANPRAIGGFAVEDARATSPFDRGAVALADRHPRHHGVHLRVGAMPQPLCGASQTGLRRTRTLVTPLRPDRPARGGGDL
jgi:hypothetical protein